VVIRRATLRKLVVPKATDEGVNYNDGWEMDPEDLTWPQYGQVRLTYPDLPDGLVLGGIPQDYREPDRLAELIPSLVADLIAEG
jgi:hypothetical protein